MNIEEYENITSEIKELERLLDKIPENNVIERIGLKHRLESARSTIAGIAKQRLSTKARLVFRGRPVFGTHGIAADFASKATGAFTDAIAATAAGIESNFHYMGPIPDKRKNQLLITGTAIGSFGFEFEVPDQEVNLFQEPSAAEKALQKVQKLFQLAADGSDDDLAELVDEIHPRAVKKTAEFLDYIIGQEAWCGLEYKKHFFKFDNVDHLRITIERLREDNIRVSDDTFSGEFQGVLPKSRAFEFKLSDQKDIIRGKVGSDIEDPDALNRNWLHKPVQIKMHIIQVGQGRPRYTLQSLDDIQAF